MGTVQVRAGDHTVTLDGRAAAIVCWIAQHAPQVNASPKVKLEFNCAGPKIHPQCATFLDETPLTVRG